MDNETLRGIIRRTPVANKDIADVPLEDFEERCCEIMVRDPGLTTVDLGFFCELPISFSRGYPNITLFNAGMCFRLLSIGEGDYLRDINEGAGYLREALHLEPTLSVYVLQMAEYYLSVDRRDIAGAVYQAMGEALGLNQQMPLDLRKRVRGISFLRTHLLELENKLGL